MTDKKVKLDELPDEGSSIEPAKTPASISKSAPKTSKKELVDPRLERIKNLGHAEKVEEMVQRWRFDRPVATHGWMLFVAFFIVLQILNPYEQYLAEVDQMEKNTMGFGSILNLGGILSEFVRRPIVLIFLTPFLFKFSTLSDYFFEVAFDGLYSVKSVKEHSEVTPSRVFLKWNDIEKVEKVKKGEREVLQLFSPEGKIAELIWDISDDKKHAVRTLLKGLINEKHPLRQFLEKDKK